MKPKAKMFAALPGLLLFLLCLSLPLHAQDDESATGEDSSSHATYTNLFLQVDRNGATRFNLSSSASISGNPELEQFFTASWNCTLDQQSFPTPPIRLSRLSSEQRKAYAAAWKEMTAHNIAGVCQGLLQRHGLTMQGSVDFQPLLDRLRQNGMENLHVTVSFSSTVLSPAIRATAPGMASSRIFSYDLPVAAPVSPFQISFGYSRPDLIWLSFWTVLFVLAPVAIVLVMRGAALRRGGEDPTGAWFSFMRTILYCVNGTFLLWGVTHLNTRAQLSDLLAFAGWSSGWRHILALVVVFTLPPWTAYLLCTALSYKVFVRIRNVSATWSQFMAQHVSMMARLFFPLTLYLAALLNLLDNFQASFSDFQTRFGNLQVSLALIGLAWVSRMVFTQIHQKAAKSHPSAITSGPLRDRIFALAQNMGVKVQQVFVLPAAHSGSANAFATAKQTVIFTDYLIEKLSQREVDAIAAHELTHLRHNHAQMLGLMIVGAMVLPGWIVGFLRGTIEGMFLFAPASSGAREMVNRIFFSDWTQAGLILLCFWVLYAVQKRFEYTADAGAVQVTRDPEAMITALVKLSRLNLMPLQWSRSAEATLTHPSTLRRLERIAGACAMPQPHLQQLIAQAELPAGPASAAPSYSVAANTTGVVAVGKAAGRTQSHLLFLVAMHVIPPTAIAFCLHRYLPQAPLFSWPALLGVAGCVALYYLGMTWVGRNKQLHMIKSVKSVLAGRTAPFRMEEGVPVGFAPGPCPRFFATSYNWDDGLLFFSREKLVFIGSHASLGLRREQIRSVLLGEGAPSWNNWQRIYFSWEEQAGGKSGTFNLLPLNRRGLFGSDTRDVYLRIRAWRNQQQPSLEGEVSSPLGVPSFGAVTSKSPKEINNFAVNFNLTAIMLALAAGLSALVGPGSWLYIAATVLLIRVFESIPYWRYRERPLVYEAANAPVVTRPEPRLAPPPPPPPPALTPEDQEQEQLVKTATS